MGCVNVFVAGFEVAEVWLENEHSKSSGLYVNTYVYVVNDCYRFGDEWGDLFLFENDTEVD